MTRSEIQTQLDKLNGAQRAALRNKFRTRFITYLRVDSSDGYIEVQFGNGITHSMWIGVRGGLRNHSATTGRIIA